jgi:hypothetical protein
LCIGEIVQREIACRTQEVGYLIAASRSAIAFVGIEGRAIERGEKE